MRNILIIGDCGSGKTWVMKQVIKKVSAKERCKFNLIRFLKKDKLCLLGKYVGETFDGSDKLSMAVSRDFEKFNFFLKKNNYYCLCEGDRFTNKKFLLLFNPIVIRIKDNGENGRKTRGSKQSEQHLKRINTRVNNIKADIEVMNSTEALKKINEIIKI